MERSSRSVPTGPGSRGGRWHEPEFRRAYGRAWRLAHPEYRERERRRKARARGKELTDIAPAAQLPAPLIRCICPDCSCGNDIVVPVTCRMCEEGLHG